MKLGELTEQSFLEKKLKSKNLAAALHNFIANSGDNVKIAGQNILNIFAGRITILHSSKKQYPRPSKKPLQTGGDEASWKLSRCAS